MVALSKGIGTGMVTVFVFMRYPDHSFVQMLAIMVAVLDLTYTIGLIIRRTREAHRHLPAIV